MQPDQYPQPAGTAVVPVGAYDTVTGLEDLDASDLRLPRLSIDHEHGGYIDSLNPANVMPEIHVIPLGLVKQRVMWPALMTDDGGDSNPMCKSVDHSTGYPNITSTDKRELFPWQAAGWDPNHFPRDEAGRITLPCNSCRLKDWKSHPDGKKTWCSEQHAIVLLYAPVDPTVHLQQEPSMLALFTAQRSSINASKAFFGGMMRQQKPAFAFRARWTLRKEQRGKNTYYTPLMTIVGTTDSADWDGYAAPYLEVRQFITQPPRVRDDDQQAGVSGADISQQNQMGAGFQANTWVPGQPQQQQQPVVIQQQPVDPAYVEWQRQQAAAAQAQAQAAQSAPAVVMTAQGPTLGPPKTPAASVLEMPPPFATAPAQPAPSSPTNGRDEDDPLPF